MGSFLTRNSFILALGAGLFCGSAFAGDQFQYLAVTGPSPLRFQRAGPRYDPAEVLPPLQMSDAPAASVTNIVEELPKTVKEPVNFEASENTPADPVVPRTVVEPVPEQNAVAPGYPQEAKPAPSQLTPQMLLRYFSEDGSKEVVVPAPLEFTPPTPSPSAARSSAVYTSPPGKSRQQVGERQPGNHLR